MRFRNITLLIITFSACVAADAQTLAPATQKSSDNRNFFVTPAAPAVPASTYRFDFPRDMQYDGNGVAAFLQALLTLPDDKLADDLYTAADTESDVEFVKRIHEHSAWLDTKIPTVIATAIRYQTCSFDFPTREQGINLLLPYLNPTRGLVNYLQYKARFATATGEWKQSIELIRAIFIVAQKTDEGDTFIVNNVIAVNFGQLGVEEIHRLANRPEAPNLYWALRQLPSPFGNLRTAIHSGEECPQEMTFSDLKEARLGHELSAATWKRATDEVIALMRMFRDFEMKGSNLPAENASHAVPDQIDPDVLAAARKDYAQRFHHSDHEVEALDSQQVVSAFYYYSYRLAVDELLKWASLPYPEALPALRKDGEVARSLTQANQSQPDNPFMKLGIKQPAYPFSFSRALEINARLDRAIAACATVEALRAFAAAHDGHLPKSLAEIVDTPAPVNPATGKPFEYSVTGDTAVISDPGQWMTQSLRYEVRLRK